MKLGETKNKGDCYLLRNEMNFRLAKSFLFRVNQTIWNDWSICNFCPSDIKNYINSVFLPCCHAKMCYDCARKKGNCVECSEKTTEIRRLIDICY